MDIAIETMPVLQYRFNTDMTDIVMGFNLESDERAILPAITRDTLAVKPSAEVPIARTLNRPKTEAILKMLIISRIS